MEIEKGQDVFARVGCVQAMPAPLNGDQGTAHFLGEKGFVKDFRLVEGNQLVVGAVKMEKWRVIGAYVSEG